MGAPENDPRFSPGSLSRNNTLNVTLEPDPSAIVDQSRPESEDTVGALPSEEGKNYNAEMAKPSKSSLRKPSFSMAKQIGISGQQNLHIILPVSAARATAAGSLTDMSECIVDMSIPTSTSSGTPFPGLTLKNIKGSLIIAGRVSGPVHITNVKDSTLVIVSRQVRIHDCKNVDLYLHCASHPIIEDCSGMRFSPLPQCYVSPSLTPSSFAELCKLMF